MQNLIPVMCLVFPLLSCLCVVIKYMCYDSYLVVALCRRRKVLSTGLNKSLCEKIKLTTNDLKIAQKHTTRLLQKFYPRRIFHRMQESEVEFWENRGLQEHDWKGVYNDEVSAVSCALWRRARLVQ